MNMKDLIRVMGKGPGFMALAFFEVALVGGLAAHFGSVPEGMTAALSIINAAVFGGGVWKVFAERGNGSPASPPSSGESPSSSSPGSGSGLSFEAENLQKKSDMRLTETRLSPMDSSPAEILPGCGTSGSTRITGDELIKEFGSGVRINCDVDRYYGEFAERAARARKEMVARDRRIREEYRVTPFNSDGGDS